MLYNVEGAVKADHSPIGVKQGLKYVGSRVIGQ
jgi:hypothetical protein